DLDPSPHKKRYLVFLHGLGSDLTAWKSERETLRNLGFPTLALDLRGHGLSGRPDNESAYELGNFVKDVLSVLEKEGIEKPVLVGHCFGGMVAIALEGTYSKNVHLFLLIQATNRRILAKNLPTMFLSIRLSQFLQITCQILAEQGMLIIKNLLEPGIMIQKEFLPTFFIPRLEAIYLPASRF
ncbi:MAG: alpha/beta fold hydrolase, partial [Candidatus Levybacteria bacterium]|nr:alpha/beta fold hydrolase [Candidatus Levybacteria bacterium]